MSAIQQKPKTLSNTLNTISLSWENICTIKSSVTNYTLQIQNDFGDWKHVYWGSNSQFLVEDLAPCTCYNFRIKYINDQCKSDWLNFKSATEAIQYFVMHVTRAVKFGKTSVIRKILTKRPMLLETESKEGKTPLIQAVENGNLAMVTFLLNIGANSNLQIATLLLDKGALESEVDCNRLTAFHYAVDSNILDNVRFCLDHEFDVNAADNKGWTPLLRGVILSCTDEIISLLLKNGADPTHKDKSGLNFHQHLEINNKDNNMYNLLTNMPNVKEKYDVN